MPMIIYISESECVIISKGQTKVTFISFESKLNRVCDLLIVCHLCMTHPDGKIKNAKRIGVKREILDTKDNE